MRGLQHRQRLVRANLPGHAFEEVEEPVTIEEYVALHPEDRVAGVYLKSREAEVPYWRKRLDEGATLEQVEQIEAEVAPPRLGASGSGWSPRDGMIPFTE